MEDSELSEVARPAPKRGKKRTSDAMEGSELSDMLQPAPKALEEAHFLLDIGLDWIVQSCIFLFCTVRDDDEDKGLLHD